jgi:hypothetical protein
MCIDYYTLYFHASLLSAPRRGLERGAGRGIKLSGVRTAHLWPCTGHSWPRPGSGVDPQGGRAHAAGVEPTYTPTQGQYLAFIYYYTKIHGVAPAEADMQRYFQTSPPAIHQMIVTLQKRGLIDRVPGQARSIRLLLTRDRLPDLE